MMTNPVRALTPDIISWIADNADADVSRLRLRFGADPIMADAILQIECRRKYARKFNRTLLDPAFRFPSVLAAEQATSDRLAEAHAMIAPAHKLSLLDMTAGLGIDAMHSAAEATSVTAIEMRPETADNLRINARSAGLLNMQVICADSVQWLTEHPDCRFDMIFIDPARRGEQNRRLFGLADCQPDVISLLPVLRQRCRTLVIKASPMLDITETLRLIPDATRIYAIGTHDECRELVIIADFGKKESDTAPEIHALTMLSDSNYSDFTFTAEAERDAMPAYAVPASDAYLLEPWPAVMKAAPFNLLCSNSISKLHPNTHLYLSHEPVHHFPGSVYRIESVIPFASSTLKILKKQGLPASVATRNFPLMSADSLRARLRLKECSSRRLIAATAIDGPYLITVTH